MQKIILLFLIVLIGLSVFQFASAQDKWGLERLSSTDLPKGTPAEVMSRVINYLLGFVGVVLIAILVYGGFTYMTSAGNEKKIESAKKILTYAIIGVVIIFASYIIANYTIRALTAGG